MRMLFCLLLLFMSSCDLPQPADGADFPSPQATPDAVNRDVIDLLNVERAKVGVGPVAYDSRLAQASVAWAYECRRGKFLDHSWPADQLIFAWRDYDANGRIAWNERAWYCGWPENTTIGEVGGKFRVRPLRAADIVRGWMRSPAHRNVILMDRWHYVGVGKSGDVVFMKLGE